MKLSEMDSSPSWDKLTVLLRHGAPDVLHLQVEVKAPLDRMGAQQHILVKKGKGEARACLDFY